MVIGLGTDIVEIERIDAMIKRHGESFLKRVYTDSEINYCQKRKQNSEAFAGRWAAKEAVMKVLGTGFVKGIGFMDIEIISEQSGKPVVQLLGGAKDRADLLGIDDVLISISHCKLYATATAIGVGLSLEEIDDVPF